MIQFKVMERNSKPGVIGSEETLFYAAVMNPGKVDINDLCKRISLKCTVTRADCLAVLSALQEEIKYALLSGIRVHLGDVGCFRMSCNSGSSPTAEEVTAKNIKRLKVIYTPSVELCRAINLKNGEVRLAKIDGTAVLPEEPEADGGGGV